MQIGFYLSVASTHWDHPRNRKLAHPHFLIDRAFAPYYHSF